jgi:hypothetical protein
MRTALVVLCSISFAAFARQDENLLALPSANAAPLDLGLLLKDTSLCIFPFVKESAAASDREYLEAIQRTFFEVAKESKLLRDTVLIDQSTHCEPHDGACVSAVGKLARCQNVLVGSSAAKGNGFVLSVRIFQVGRQAVLPGSEVEQVLETDRQSDVQAWAEGQACRALQVRCAGRLSVDADRRDMNIYVDNRLAPRSFKSPEQFGVQPGVHEVRVSIGQRTSLARKVAVRRNSAAELVYVRQTDRGGIPLWSMSELAHAPEPSVEFHEARWTRPVGYTVAGVGAVALGLGIAEALHGKALNDQANARFARNHVYLPTDVATLDSAHSATTTANVLFAVSAALVAAGLTTAFVF